MKRFKITGDNDADGAEFEVEDDATEEDIAKAAFECAVEYFNFGWEPAEDDGE